MPWLSNLVTSERNGAHGNTPTDIHDPEYIGRHLIGQPATERVEAFLADLIGKREDAPEGQARVRLENEISAVEFRLEHCRQRDQLAQGRPDECWCLGAGGKHARYGLDGERIYDETCGCPEGVAHDDFKRRRQLDQRARDQAVLLRRLFGEAGVPTRFKDCTFDTYPVLDGNRIAFEAVKFWQLGPGEDATEDEQNRSREQKKSLLIHGPYGTGKTGLAAAIVRNEIETMGEPALFFTVPTLLDHVRRTYGPSPQADEHEVVERIKSTGFLVLDDLGAERVTEWVREKLFTIINHRHDEDLPTVFTSNLDIAQLGEHIGERTTWRLVEMCEVVKLDGPNLRDRKDS